MKKITLLLWTSPRLTKLYKQSVPYLHSIELQNCQLNTKAAEFYPCLISTIFKMFFDLALIKSMHLLTHNHKPSHLMSLNHISWWEFNTRENNWLYFTFWLLIALSKPQNSFFIHLYFFMLVASFNGLYCILHIYILFKINQHHLWAHNIYIFSLHVIPCSSVDHV